MKPSFGYTLFYVTDVEATVAVFEQAFGLERRFVTPEGDYGELDTGATTLSFAANDLARANLDAAGGSQPGRRRRLHPHRSDRPPVGATIAFLIDDVASAVRAAVAAGATPYTEPTEKPWGQTVAYVRDPNGILIELATPITG